MPRKVSATQANKLKIPCKHGHIGQWQECRSGKWKTRRCYECKRKDFFKYTYGIDNIDSFDYSAGCFICGRKVRLVVDHHHLSGEVRKLLCYKCNNLIGHLETLEAPLEKYLEYVKWELS